MSYDGAMDTAGGDLWHVQLGSGEVCTMTLDLLDDAFQDGIIDENTFVWQEGTSGWSTLGEVAGLDSVDSDAAVLMSSRTPDSSWPTTVIAPTYPPTSLDPRELANPYSLTPLSTAPVAGDIIDIDFDVEAVSFRRRKRSKFRWVIAAAFIGAIGYGAVKRQVLVERYRVYLPPSVAARIARIAPASFAAALRPAPPPPAPVAAPVPPPAPPSFAPAAVVTEKSMQDALATATPGPTTAPAADTRLSDDKKRALEQADKSVAEKQKQKQQQRQKSHASSSPSKPRPKSANPFHKGGDQFDPLNSSL